jgi:hypothetical protein
VKNRQLVAIIYYNWTAKPGYEASHLPLGHANRRLANWPSAPYSLFLETILEHMKNFIDQSARSPTPANWP